jgi:D-sedoheptulose 7-phosphate isomerase
MTNLDRMLAEATGAGEYARRYVQYLGSLLAGLDFTAVERFVQVLERARDAGRTVFFAGNGGSAATASHWANDLLLGTRDPAARPFRAVSLADNAAVLTCLANDREYADVFVGQLEGLLESGDVLVVISASGNSPNVVRAAEFARSHGATTIGLVGFDGGQLRTLCDVVIQVTTPKGEYGPVEDAHLVLDHIVTGWLAMRRRAGSGT